MATSNAPIARTGKSSMTSQRSPRSSPNIGGLLRAWEDTYNNIRPHQALGYLTPNEFLRRFNR
ncbi:MAG TPA: integrase core domain-containing protein [bacterium]|nr:integrase core domain-containing protein [bacterium]